MLCLEELHAISDTLGKHLEYENTQKEIDFFSIWQFEKKITPKSFNPCFTGLQSGMPLTT